MAMGSKTPLPLEKPMPRRRQVYEGTKKILYEGPEADTFVLYFKDEQSPDGEIPNFLGRGALNTRISELLMSRLNDVGIMTHFIKRLSMREHLVQAADPLSFTVTVVNIATGDFSNRFGLEDPQPLVRPVCELRYRDKECRGAVLSPHHVLGLELGTQEDIETIFKQAQRANDFLYGQFLGLGYRLAEFTLEFGHAGGFSDHDSLVIIDEITPDTLKLIDLSLNPPLCPPVPTLHHQVAERLGILKDGGPLDLQDTIVYSRDLSDCVKN